MSFVEILKVIVLGIVEGITEWLPISSTGHLILVEEFIKLKMTEDFMSMFNVVIQLGAILAVVVIYFHKLNPFSNTKTQKQKMLTLQLWVKVLIASVPAAIPLPEFLFLPRSENPVCLHDALRFPHRWTVPDPLRPASGSGIYPPYKRLP